MVKLGFKKKDGDILVENAVIKKKSIVAGIDRIIFPLDVSTVDEALDLVRRLSPYVGLFKIGLELIYSLLVEDIILDDEEEAIQHLRKKRELFNLLQGKVFLDGKFHDIPNTISGVSAVIAKLGVRMFNVHASGGIKAIQEAAKKKGDALLLVVTILTSLDKKTCKSIYGDEPEAKVVQFTREAMESGADGIICSPEELRILAKYPEFDNVIKVTPGIRPGWADINDQQRIGTPYGAVIYLGDYFVIGRPIREPPKEVGSSEDAVFIIEDEIWFAEEFARTGLFPGEKPGENLGIWKKVTEELC